jgi:hypothetical protein
LIERHPQGLVRKMSIFDVNRSAEHADPARIELAQKFVLENVCASTLFVQVHWKIEVHVDHAVRMQSTSARFD